MTARRRGYRERLAKRGGLYCVDAAKSKCDGPIEADHEVRLADNGPQDWTSGRCRKHHLEKTRAEAKAARGRRLRGNWRGALAGGVLAVGAAGCLLVAWQVWIPLVAALGLALWWAGERAARRALVVERLTAPLAAATHTPANAVRVRVTGWDRDVPECGGCWYGPLCDDAPGSADRAAVEALLTRKVGRGLRFVWDPVGNVVLWRPRSGDVPVPAAATSPLPAALAATWRGDWRVDETGDEVTVVYPPSVKVWQPETRVELVDLVATIKGGRWRLSVQAATSTAVLSRRPVMPEQAIEAKPSAGDRLGIGICEDGGEINWDLTALPHALVTGTTGSGKTMLLRRWARTAHGKGWDVRCVDPKRFELAPLRREGITVVSATDAMCAMVTDTYEEMEDRNTAREQAIDAGEPQPEFGRILFILDEVTEFIERANEAHKAAGNRTGEHPANAKLRSLARLARAAKITVVLGIQRPDAKILGGEARSNYGMRVALGPLEPDAARMMFGTGRSDVGRDTPMAGRASVALDQRITEVQTYWDPS